MSAWWASVAAAALQARAVPLQAPSSRCACSGRRLTTPFVVPGQLRGHLHMGCNIEAMSTPPLRCMCMWALERHAVTAWLA